MNRTHYLLVTVSGHLLVRATGRVFHQKKAHGIKLKRIEQAVLTPLVHFFIYDPESQARYAELGCKGHMPNLYEFLKRAYDPALSALNIGPDQAIVVPESVVEVYPDIVLNLEKMGLRALKPISGFKSGIAYLRTWEKELS